MNIFQLIIILCWVVFLFYWGINWTKVKPTQEKKFDFLRFRRILLLFVILVLLNHFVLNNPFHLSLCQWEISGCHYGASVVGTSILLHLLGDVVAVVGLVIAILARKTLADNWSATIDLKKGHELVTSGVYNHMRHPIYTGVLLMLLGGVLVFQTVTTMLAFIFVLALFLFRIKNEEVLMTKTFPKEYPAYKKRVKALIPFLF